MNDGGCILSGHQFYAMPGVGDYVGRQFTVCQVCGKTEEIFTVQPEDYAGLPTELGRSDHHCAGSPTAINAHDAGSSRPNSVRRAADPVNRTDLASISAAIVGTGLVTPIVTYNLMEDGSVEIIDHLKDQR